MWPLFKTKRFSGTNYRGSISGLLKLDSLGAIPWSYSRQWLYDVNAGVLNSNSILTSVAAIPLTDSIMGLAVSSYGSGISVSADSGLTWSHILNQAAVKGDLGSIRMVPSVIVAGGESLVAYKVGKPSKITIEVFSYDMRRVRTIVKEPLVRRMQCVALKRQKIFGMDMMNMEGHVRWVFIM